MLVRLGFSGRSLPAQRSGSSVCFDCGGNTRAWCADQHFTVSLFHCLSTLSLSIQSWYIFGQKHRVPVTTAAVPPRMYDAAAPLLRPRGPPPSPLRVPPPVATRTSSSAAAAGSRSKLQGAKKCSSSSLYTETHEGASKLQRLSASSTSPRHSGQLPVGRRQERVCGCPTPSAVRSPTGGGGGSGCWAAMAG